MKMLQLKLVLIFVWQCFVIVYCDDYCDPLMVRTSDGMVKGIYQRTYLDNKTYIAFKGIPYAQPPVGELRFRVILCFYYIFFEKNQLRECQTEISKCF